MNDTIDPAVASAIREELILRVEATPPGRRTRRRAGAPVGEVRTARGGLRISGVIATGVTLVLVVGASLAAIGLGTRSGGTGPAIAPTAPPASIEVGGKSIPFAGVVRWSDAVSEQQDRRLVTIAASGSVPNPPTWLCRLAAWRASTVETATAVTIEVQGYAVPMARGARCTDDAPAPHALTVRLDAPLGGRSLIDASTSNPRPVFDAADIPILALIPDENTQTVTWDQDSGTATRTYTDSRGSFVVSLAEGTPAALAADGAASGPPVDRTISIHGAAGTLWRFESAHDGRSWQLEWTDVQGRRYRIVADQRYTEDEVILMAKFLQSANPSDSSAVVQTPDPERGS